MYRFTVQKRSKVYRFTVHGVYRFTVENFRNQETFPQSQPASQSGGRTLGLSATAGRLVGSTTMPPVAS